MALSFQLYPKQRRTGKKSTVKNNKTISYRSISISPPQDDQQLDELSVSLGDAIQVYDETGNSKGGEELKVKGRGKQKGKGKAREDEKDVSRAGRDKDTTRQRVGVVTSIYTEPKEGGSRGVGGNRRTGRGNSRRKQLEQEDENGSTKENVHIRIRWMIYEEDLVSLCGDSGGRSKDNRTGLDLELNEILFPSFFSSSSSSTSYHHHLEKDYPLNVFARWFGCLGSSTDNNNDEEEEENYERDGKLIRARKINILGEESWKATTTTGLSTLKSNKTRATGQGEEQAKPKKRIRTRKPRGQSQKGATKNSNPGEETSTATEVESEGVGEQKTAIVGNDEMGNGRFFCKRRILLPLSSKAPSSSLVPFDFPLLPSSSSFAISSLPGMVRPLPDNHQFEEFVQRCLGERDERGRTATGSGSEGDGDGVSWDWGLDEEEEEEEEIEVRILPYKRTQKNSKKNPEAGNQETIPTKTTIPTKQQSQSVKKVRSSPRNKKKEKQADDEELEVDEVVEPIRNKGNSKPGVLPRADFSSPTSSIEKKKKTTAKTRTAKNVPPGERKGTLSQDEDEDQHPKSTRHKSLPLPEGNTSSEDEIPFLGPSTTTKSSLSMRKGKGKGKRDVEPGEMELMETIRPHKERKKVDLLGLESVGGRGRLGVGRDGQERDDVEMDNGDEDGEEDLETNMHLNMDMDMDIDIDDDDGNQNQEEKEIHQSPTRHNNGKKKAVFRKGGKKKRKLVEVDMTTDATSEGMEEEEEVGERETTEDDEEEDSGDEWEGSSSEEEEDEEVEDYSPTSSSSSEDEDQKFPDSDYDDYLFTPGSSRRRGGTKSPSKRVAKSPRKAGTGTPSRRSTTGTPRRRRMVGVVGTPGRSPRKRRQEMEEEIERRREERKQKRLARGPPQLPLSSTYHSLLTSSSSFASLTPFQKARHMLHVGATPEFLPCREDEFAEVEAYLEDAVEEGSGVCVYIAGVPGTGKTATVMSVIGSMQERVRTGHLPDFRFIEINAMKLTEPQQAFVSLWEFLSDGERLSAKSALNELERYFSNGGGKGKGKQRKMTDETEDEDMEMGEEGDAIRGGRKRDEEKEICIVLVDELDQLVTKKQEVIYNFFDWPNRAGSKLIVVAIANTMDLPEREFLSKVRSRLGSNRVLFHPYTSDQLIKILEARLESPGIGNVFEKDGIKLAAKKVAAVTGDARRALDICRRTIEMVELEHTQSTVSNNASPRLCNANDVVKTYKAMTSAGPLGFVRKLGLHQKVLLLGVAKESKKRGGIDIEVGEVIRYHYNFLRNAGITPIPTHDDLFSSLASLSGMRLLTLETGTNPRQRLDYFRRVRKVLEDEDLENLVKEDGSVGRFVK